MNEGQILVNVRILRFLFKSNSEKTARINGMPPSNWFIVTRQCSGVGGTIPDDSGQLYTSYISSDGNGWSVTVAYAVNSSGPDYTILAPNPVLRSAAIQAGNKQPPDPECLHFNHQRQLSHYPAPWTLMEDYPVSWRLRGLLLLSRPQIIDLSIPILGILEIWHFIIRSSRLAPFFLGLKPEHIEIYFQRRKTLNFASRKSANEIKIPISLKYETEKFQSKPYTARN
ncbi:hypothetical protein TcasGA2_TC003610 [Tribolium castaneum]|uniref:Uncharacterized protein n=1 Tax=Tribolium castaneum TaxID=7070 RepID=D6WI99_TRICA|nr:hypothetical protein TcasGA2_TC003610 [Tribolium castaneum]